MGTPKELPAKFVRTAYSTAITLPLPLSTGPPLPPWVVGASNTTSVRVTSPMWPWVAEADQTRLAQRFRDGLRDALEENLAHDGAIGLGEDGVEAGGIAEQHHRLAGDRPPACQVQGEDGDGTLTQLDPDHGQVHALGHALGRELERLGLVGKEGPEDREAGLHSLPAQAFGRRVLPPGLGHVAVGEEQASSVHQKAGAEEFLRKERTARLGGEHGRAVFPAPGLAVVAQGDTEGTSLRVVEGVAALDEPYTAREIADDSLSRRALGLQGGDARASSLEVGAHRLLFRQTGHGEQVAEPFLPSARVGDLVLQPLPLVALAQPFPGDAVSELPLVLAGLGHSIAELLHVHAKLAVLPLPVDQGGRGQAEDPGQHCGRRPEGPSGRRRFRW